MSPGDITKPRTGVEPLFLRIHFNYVEFKLDFEFAKKKKYETTTLDFNFIFALFFFSLFAFVGGEFIIQKRIHKSA